MPFMREEWLACPVFLRVVKLFGQRYEREDCAQNRKPCLLAQLPCSGRLSASSYSGRGVGFPSTERDQEVENNATSRPGTQFALGILPTHFVRVHRRTIDTNR